MTELNDIINDVLDMEDEQVNHKNKPLQQSKVNVSEQDLENLKADRIPINTQRRVNWVIKKFHTWHEEWKCRLTGGLKVYKDLKEMTLSDIDFCLQYFIAEIRKSDGEMFPPKTYKEIISSFQHHLNNALGIKCSIFLDHAFLETRKVLDAQMKRSAAAGNVKQPKRSHSISFNDEEEL